MSMINEIDLTPGAELPVLTRPAGLAAWNRFAAVNDEFVPIHMDDDAGRAAGFSGAIGMGNLQWSYFHILLRQTFGESAKIERIACQYRLPSLKDTVLSIRARIAEVNAVDGGTEVELVLWSEDDQERQIASGSATVRL
jgi:hypothetical protein